MFSVIVCSVDPAKLAAVRVMYESIFRQSEWEFIHIPDARSLTEGYSRGIDQSKGDYVVLSHDDIYIFSPDTAARLKGHLNEFDLIGVAGTGLLLHPNWASAGPPHIFGQVASPYQDGKVAVSIFGAPDRAISNIQALDGLFMAARRSVFSRVGFDTERFDGFHLYDVDLSYAAFRAGLRVAIANDICIYHTSAGKYDEAWMKYAERFHRKWFPTRNSIVPREFKFSYVVVSNFAEALEVMNPRYWTPAR